MTYTNATDAGPLQILIGTWHGHRGFDVAPDPDGTEKNSYRERLTINPVRNLSNAEKQKLIAVQYHQLIHRVNDNRQIHDQCGYWIWDEAAKTIIHSFSLPRGLTVIAGGTLAINENKCHTFSVESDATEGEWRIQQSPFLQSNALTRHFKQTLTVKGSELNYQQTTTIDIYNSQFEHTDENTLIRAN